MDLSGSLRTSPHVRRRRIPPIGEEWRRGSASFGVRRYHSARGSAAVAAAIGVDPTAQAQPVWCGRCAPGMGAGGVSRGAGRVAPLPGWALTQSLRYGKKRFKNWRMGLPNGEHLNGDGDLSSSPRRNTRMAKRQKGAFEAVSKGFGVNH